MIQKGELLFLVGGSRSLSALTEIQTLDTEILPKLCLPARMPWRLFLASTRNQRFKHACACFLPSSLLLNILLTNYPFSFLLLFSEMGTYTVYVVTYDIYTYSYILSFFASDLMTQVDQHPEAGPSAGQHHAASGHLKPHAKLTMNANGRHLGTLQFCPLVWRGTARSHPGVHFLTPHVGPNKT